MIKSIFLATPIVLLLLSSSIASSRSLTLGRGTLIAKNLAVPSENLFEGNSIFDNQEIFTLAARGKKRRPSSKSVNNNEFRAALTEIRNRDYEEASIRLEKLVKATRSRKKKMKIKSVLGKVFNKMNLPQSAGFQFLEIVKRGKRTGYYDEALRNLFIIADGIDSDSFLKYSLEKMADSEEVVRSQLYHFRYGEYLLKKKDFEGSIRQFQNVKADHRSFTKAKYLQAIAYAEIGEEKRAATTLKVLANFHDRASVSDFNLNTAYLGLGRVYYQKKEFDKAVDYYRLVPKDSSLWHSTLGEVSWAQFRSGRFREILGALNTLHSTFYEDNFLPESVLLRSLVYLSICHNEEADKTLEFFQKVYRPMRARLIKFVKGTTKYETFYRIGSDLMRRLENGEVTDEDRANAEIPIPVVRTMLDNPKLKRTLRYIGHLENEYDEVRSKSRSWQNSDVGQSVNKLILRRLKFAERLLGKQIQKHLQFKRREFAHFFRQYDFAKYEMKASRKRKAKQELQLDEGKVKVTEKKTIDEGFDRSFFIRSGLEYWPFHGEYWLDEIGNYHFIGQSNCGRT